MAILNLDYNALWESICNWSRKAGRAATRPVFLIWYVMRSKDTPISTARASLAILLSDTDGFEDAHTDYQHWLVWIARC